MMRMTGWMAFFGALQYESDIGGVTQIVRKTLARLPGDR